MALPNDTLKILMRDLETLSGADVSSDQTELAKRVLASLKTFDDLLSEAVSHRDDPDEVSPREHPAEHLGRQDCYEAGILEGQTRLVWKLRGVLNTGIKEN